MDWIYPITIIVLLAFMIWQDKAHREERKELMDRIMAKDYREFRREQRVEEPRVEEDEEMLSYWDN